MIGHLGPRTSALLDGQLSPADEERAWEHVHSCHLCRDQVEREGWVKTRLAAMSYAASSAPDHLKGSLLVPAWDAVPPPTAEDLYELTGSRHRRGLGMSALSGGAVGAAVMGVLALGASPANAPGVLEGPVGGSFGGSLTSAITTAVDHTYGPTVAPQPSHRRDRARDADRFVQALRRTLLP